MYDQLSSDGHTLCFGFSIVCLSMTLITLTLTLTHTLAYLQKFGEVHHCKLGLINESPTSVSRVALIDSRV